MILTSVVISLVTCVLAPLLTRAAGRNAGWFLAIPLFAAAAVLVTATGGDFTRPVEQRVAWMPTLDVSFALRLDGLSLVFALLVLVMGGLILAYSARYLGRDGKHGTFYLLMTAFAASMLVLVMTDDLVVLFVAWEATTLCSFFLIGRSGPGAREPAIRTLLVTAAGGLLLLAAVATMAIGTGTTQISDVLTDSIWRDDPAFTATVAVLLAGAAFTKSAQFPFQAWLPDSMVAITPVSAYLHAAAMVKAGIYLLLRFSPPLAGETLWTVLLVTSGLVTALLGAAGALRRFDLKELLAYSTISQLGLLVVMIGVGTEASLKAAVIHTIAHALFKSALFMLIGVIDHQAGTRDMRELKHLRTRMPVTFTALVLGAASMAGLPPLLGFVSKEGMFAAFLEVHGPVWFPVLLVAGTATTSALTLAYSARIVLGAFAGKEEPASAGTREAHEAPAAFWAVPALGAASGLVLGVLPFLLDSLVAPAATATAGTPVDVHLALWHGLNPELAVSAVVIAVGTGLVLARRPVEVFMLPRGIPVSGLAIVDRTRQGIIRLGAVVGNWTGSTSPSRHLGIPAVCLAIIAVAGISTVGELPSVVGNPSRPEDWLLLILVAAGVASAVYSHTRYTAIVVTGIIGFAMTLWYFILGAADVALTQLLVEILTVCVLVLVLRRLPNKFPRESRKKRLGAGLVAVAAGTATTIGVWALTGRREMSEAAEYFMTQGEEATGGANLVNTILVDFRALDTLGEVTVLGVAGIAIAALLRSRAPSAIRSAKLDTGTPIYDSLENSVFLRVTTRVLGPLIIVLSLYLLLRGHQEPGGGFISALVGGAGFALLYLAAPSDAAARIRWPYLGLIGAGFLVAAGTGFMGYLEGSFLTPLHTEVLGVKLTSPLLFDVGVYLGVLGVMLAAFNLLGRHDEHSDPTHPSHDAEDEEHDAFLALDDMGDDRMDRTIEDEVTSR
ncbi:DUF4040 family protein [Kocuria coralli]|uniref:DUF4040 family protein n=1 Tax=Kocuria coralli TaxID=1461025 RepID=A0A5J5KTE2_9MICC|nr:DUF4040 family protein [Kocuria coralli]KAA9392893.1 DUF4040 family protein [Kocuria coralli]